MNQDFRTVQQIDKSLWVGIPHRIAKQLNIKKGDILSVSLKENKIVVESLDTFVGRSDPTVANQPGKEVVSHE